MLKSKVLCNVLSQANTGGVENSLLLTMDGALLAYSGYSDARIVSAIVSNCWTAYEKHGQNALRENRLKYIILQCETGKIFISRVANLLLCLCGNENVGLGILKQKAEALCNYLEEPLREIQNN